jgi:integrase
LYDKALWVVPAERMKGEREHIVPLSDRAIEIAMFANSLFPTSTLLFPSPADPRKPLSDMALTMMLRRMNVDATAHGFRSTFRDWCSEETNFPNEVAEMALAHAIEKKTEAAYRRGNLLQKRRDLMTAWCRYAVGEEDNSASKSG